MQHECLERNEADIQGASNRNFGITFAIVFGALGLRPLLSHNPPHLLMMLGAALFLFLALVRPVLLTVPNRLWLELGSRLNAIVSPIALGVLFYGVFTPAGVFIRVILRKRMLALDFDRNARSYWIQRIPPGPAPDSFLDQF